LNQVISLWRDGFLQKDVLYFETKENDVHKRLAHHPSKLGIGYFPFERVEVSELSGRWASYGFSYCSSSWAYRSWCDIL